MLLTVAAPLFAGEMGRPVCLAKEHDCGKTAQLRPCCCLVQGDHSNDATPAAGKTHVAQSIAEATPIVIGLAPARLGLLDHTRARTTAAHPSPPDLVTLFGTFLI